MKPRERKEYACNKLFEEYMRNLEKWAEMSSTMSGTALSLAQIKSFIDRVYQLGFDDAMEEMEKIKNMN